MAGKASKPKKVKRVKKRPIRTALAKLMVKIPFVSTLYLKTTLRYLEKTPRNKLPPELREMKTALEKLPKQKRMAAMQDAVKGNIQKPEDLPSRQLRRLAEKQQRQQQRKR